MFIFPLSQHDQGRPKEGVGTLGWRWQGWHRGPGMGRGEERPPPPALWEPPAVPYKGRVHRDVGQDQPRTSAPIRVPGVAGGGTEPLLPPGPPGTLIPWMSLPCSSHLGLLPSKQEL